jgi:hypothetical protein
MPTTFTYIADDFATSGWVTANDAANVERAAQNPPLPPRSVAEYFTFVVTPVGESYARTLETKALAISDLRKTAPREKLVAIDAEIAKSTAAIQAIIGDKAQEVEAQVRRGIVSLNEPESVLEPVSTPAPGFFSNLRERFKL